MPSNVTANELTRLYDVCSRLLGIKENGPPIDLEAHLAGWQAGHLAACAASAVEGAMFDRESLAVFVRKRSTG